MSELLSAKGAALIRAIEAGARTGMMGMRWGGRQIQRLIVETARLQDVHYVAVLDKEGKVVAHSDPDKVGLPFDQERKITHPGPENQENWELVTAKDGQRIFEVHRHFRPLTFGGQKPPRHMPMMMRHHQMGAPSTDDWFSPRKRQKLLIVIGLDVAPFEAAIRSDIRTTILLSLVLLLLGLGGFVSLFWMHNYRMAKQNLQDTSAFASEVVRHLPVGLIATDPAGRVTFFNAAAETITGLAAPRILNMEPAGRLPADLCGLGKKLEQGGVIVEHEMVCTFNGKRDVPLSISATRIINEDGAFVGQVMMLRDLSEIRRLEEAVRRQEKLAAMGGLAAGVAHEVRNPLSSIKALATFFAGQFDDGSESNEAAKVMVQEVDRLNRVITELLEFSRPTDLKKQTCDIGSLISRSVQLVQQEASDQKVAIDVSIAESICQAWIDPDRLIQCFLNLYLNAIQAMPDGGTITITAAQKRDRHIIIGVGDTGSGISTDRLSKIFDPYFTTKNKGTGLGLAVVHKIIEAHQGRIEVKSNLPRGTQFDLILPCHQSKDREETK